MKFRAASIAMLACAAFCSHLQAADIEAGKRKAEACVACHGPNGNSTMSTFPILAGQTARYIYLQLRDFKEGRRKDPQMSPMAANLNKDDMLDLAEYFAVQKPAATKFKPDPQRVALGAKKADEVLCSMCHLGGMKGQNEIPKLAGQHPEYIVKQLKDFKARTRTNDAGNMTSVSQTLSEDDIVNLSHYVGGLY